MNKVLIYCQKPSARISYIFDLILKELLGLDYSLTHNQQDFINSREPKFSYASKPVQDELFFEASQLLFEDQIKPQINELVDHENMKGLFPCSELSVCPFDLFASAFFLVSRYEEYLPYKKDKFGRYRASQSTAKSAGFLERPMVNIYARKIKITLSEKFAELKFTEPKFEYISTFDIDMAYSYANKGFIRNLGGFLRSFFFSDFNDVKARFKVLTKQSTDPYDTFDYQFNILNKFGIHSIYFFLLADHSKFDKNISHTNPDFRNLILKISEKTQFGIHYSFKVGDKKDLFEIEKTRLENIIQKSVSKNRFHYLRFEFPYSFTRLIKQNITEDYTMGYAIRSGYRASICSSFLFFNLRENKVTNLRLFPFAFMDTTLNNHNKLSPQEAIRKIRRLMENAHEVGGTFIGLWHNSSLGETGDWKGWRSVFEDTAAYAKELSNTKRE